MQENLRNIQKNITMKIGRNTGITLIALVITIIVLLILAGVTIATLTGENGILKQAENAKNAEDKAETEEREDLEEQNKVIENWANGANLTLPSTSETTPFLPTGAVVTNADLSTGVTIKDSKGNEWVWIEVPKSIYTNEAYNEGTEPTSSEDYTKIESVMQKYVGTYRREGFEDIWYSEEQHGFASAADYNNHKNTMLKSVYENGGFYIGKYEAGTQTLRTTANAPLITAVIKEGAYPYNYVTCKQAQEISEDLATGNRTSSLMFGIQWDLVLKYIETKGAKTQDELKTDSKTWGNYLKATFTAEKGQYSENNGETYNFVSEIYTKEENKYILLTTGATERNATLNIYDLAGNISEWTLEQYVLDTNNPCVVNGGNYVCWGNDYPVFSCIGTSTDGAQPNRGFRPALW